VGHAVTIHQNLYALRTIVHDEHRLGVLLANTNDRIIEAVEEETAQLFGGFE
jgi:hypothetical protein